MKLENQRSETPFAARDNMLDIRQHITELCYRGFGLKKRKLPKEPKNFVQWSDVSKQRWYETETKNLEWKTACDMRFIEKESDVLDNLCREITFLIDGANGIFPKYVFEVLDRRRMQNQAMQLCSNLKRELNYIMSTINSNKNFIVKVEEEIQNEINILRGWRKKCDTDFDTILEKEINHKKTVAEKVGVIIDFDTYKDAIREMSQEITSEGA